MKKNTLRRLVDELWLVSVIIFTASFLWKYHDVFSWSESFSVLIEGILASLWIAHSIEKEEK